MYLSAEGRRRGVVSWQVDGSAVVRTRMPSNHGSPSDWSAPLTDPAGSLCPVSPGPGWELAIVPEDPDALDRPFRVRWYGETEDTVGSAIWTEIDSPPTLVPGVPDLGTFHLLKVDTPHLVWEHAATVWHEAAILRFEQVEEPRRVDVPASPSPGGVPIDEFTVTVTTVKRGVIHVIAAGPSKATAEVQASALLGFLAVIIGEDAVGARLSRVDVEASEAETKYAEYGPGISLVEPGRRPTMGVRTAVVDMVARFLPTVLGEGRSPRRTDALRVALSAYERASRTRDVLEAFLAYFVGTESLITAYGDDIGLVGTFASLMDDPRLIAFLEGLEGEYKRNDLDWLRKSLARPNNPQRFGRYAKDHGIPKAQRGTFHRLNGLRNDVAHGNSALVSPDDARDARRLMESILKLEIGLPSPLPSEQGPRIGGVVVGGTVQPSPNATNRLIANVRLHRLDPS